MVEKNSRADWALKFWPLKKGRCWPSRVLGLAGATVAAGLTAAGPAGLAAAGSAMAALTSAAAFASAA
eukprot:5996124-Pleurochrysis_carterae.AAC.1